MRENEASRQANDFGFAAGDDWMQWLREAEQPIDHGSLGHYDIIEEIARGGQGIVYRAIETGTNREVAVKRLIAGVWATPGAQLRFYREMEAAAALQHPGIVTVFGCEAVNDQPVLIMEWIDGETATAWATADGTPRTTEDIIRVMIAICEAVHHAHQRGVIHRDLKPSNILIQRADDRPRVLDFGLAKLMPESQSQASLSAPILGTPVYAAPEQMFGEADVADVRSDVYSLGVVLYEMLTASLPYETGATVAATIRRIDRTDPRPPRRAGQRIPRELEAVVLKALSKDVRDRYQSVEALGADLDRFLNDLPVAAAGTSTAYLLSKTMRRHRVSVTIGVIALILSLAFGATMSVMYGRAEDEAAKARQVQAFLEDLMASASPYRSDNGASVLGMLHEADERVHRELRGQPDVQAGIRLAMAEIYAGFWRWDDAAPHAEMALQTYRDLHGDSHPRVADCLTLLGRARTFLNDARAIPLQEQALATRQALYGPDHALVAEVYGNLGFALWSAAEPSRLAEAEAAYLASMATYERSGSGPVSHWARNSFSYAAFLQDRGRPDDALAYLEAAVAMYRAMSGSGDIYMLQCMRAYGTCLLIVGRTDDAAAALEEAIAMQPTSIPDRGHFNALRRLAGIHHRAGRHDRALELYHGALTEYCRIAADERPRIERDVLTLAAQLDPISPSAPDYAAAFSTLRALIPARSGELDELQHQIATVVKDGGRLTP